MIRAGKEDHALGSEEGRAEAIAQMFAAGFPESQVAAALGITVEECLSYEKD